LLIPPAALGLVARQGVQVRRTALRLPDADGLTGHDGELSLYVIGDSVASGVGLEHHGESIAGRLAQLIGARYTVVAKSGDTASDTTDLVRGRLADADVIVLSIGVNDTKNLHSVRRWRQDLTALLDEVANQVPGVPVVLLGIPPMEVFPAMPRALGLAMGARARVMNRVGRAVALGYPTVRRLELTRRDLTDGAFARDGFHPSALAHEDFARRIHALLKEGDHV
jgi:lysophospholipase L1-like esterase